MKFKRLFTTKKGIAGVVIAGAVIVGSAGAAFAYFQASGSGTGQASVGQTDNLVVTGTTTSSTAVVPGGPAGASLFTVKAGGDSTAHLGTPTATILQNSSGTIYTNGTVTNGNNTVKTGCKASWFHVTSVSVPMATLAPAQSETVTVYLTMITSGNTQNACSGSLPKITLSFP